MATPAVPRTPTPPKRHSIRTTTPLIELRTMAHGAGIAGFSRMDKAKLVTAVAAKPSEYFQFVRCIKKAEAEAEAEWLNGVAHIARGAGVTTTVTEELDGAGNVKTRTTRTVTGLGSWQAYARSCSPSLEERPLDRDRVSRSVQHSGSSSGGTSGEWTITPPLVAIFGPFLIHGHRRDRD